jgi:tetratricopeptide (TPR) repeat protein
MIDRRVMELTKQASHLKESNPKKALKIIQQAKKINPVAKKDVYILVIQSYCYLKLRKPERAEAIAKKAISLGGSPFAFKILIKALVISGNFNQAEEFIAKAAQTKNAGNNKNQLAHLYLVKGDLPAAETAAREAVRLKDNSPAIGILGEVLRKQKKYAEALDELEKIKPAERMYHDYLCRAYCLMHLHFFAEAQEQFRLAEKSLAQDNFGYFDSRIRLNAGYIFLFQETLIAGETVGDELLARVKKAAHWLKEKRKDSDIGKFQRSDMLSALRAAQFYNL